MNHFFEQIKGQLATKKPFVVYRKPKESIVKAILQNNDDLHFVEDYKETGFVLTPFDVTNASILIPLDTVLVTNYKKEDTLKREEIVPFDKLSIKSDKDFHIGIVKKAINKIKSGTLEKVVLSRKIEVECIKEPLHLFKQLLAEYASAFCYLWYHPKVGMWMGATPEVLLKATNQKIETSSLAGTQVYKEGKTPIWGEKEYNEQNVVTQYIQNSLKNKVNNFNVGEIESVKAGKLWHLQTKISGLMTNNLKDILLALHPTPATCGLPKKEAKTFIVNNEGYDRKFYTGFIGELNFTEETYRNKTKRNTENRAYMTIKKATSVYANLRCAEIIDSKVIIYVGGGITIDSNPEKEWNETIAKSGTILRIVLK